MKQSSIEEKIGRILDDFQARVRACRYIPNTSSENCSCDRRLAKDELLAILSTQQAQTREAKPYDVMWLCNKHHRIHEGKPVVDQAITDVLELL